MPIIKCKMCGGDLNIVDDSTVCECEYCGTKQTVPKVDDEKKLKLFERANRLRTACEFDKAAGVYESIVADFDEEAEAYWGLILCKFGIEYVDDPATGNKVPTCHRSSFDSLMDDPNFDMVMECADPVARRVYREEAKQIEELRKRIIEVSAKEEPYDFFISYKELNDEGQRTLDSVIAQDIYAELTEKGYRVFFSRISLEDKLGVEYEPYIFAALNSAKVMLVVGTDYDYFNAVWVKNEWSRFLALIAKGEKKTLIPVFKGIDAYDMPKEFRKLAAQDMGKVGAMQDLIRGVEKLLGKKNNEQSIQQPIYMGETDAKTTAAVKRGKLSLEEGNWQQAMEFFEQALTLDAECAEAYFGKALTQMHCRNADELTQRLCNQHPEEKTLSILPALEHIQNVVEQNRIPKFLTDDEIENCYKGFDYNYNSFILGQQKLKEKAKSDFESNRNISLAYRFAKGSYHQILVKYKETLYAKLEENVQQAKRDELEAAEQKEKEYKAFLEESDNRVSCLSQKKQDERENLFLLACKKLEDASSSLSCRQAKDLFLFLDGYKDSEEYIEKCDTKAREMEAKEQEEQDERRKEQIYTQSLKVFGSVPPATLKDFEYAKSNFEFLGDYRDAPSCVHRCIEKIAELRIIEEEKEEKRRQQKAANEAKEKAAREQYFQRVKLLNTEKKKLQNEAAALRGLFTGKRKKEIEVRLVEIEEELSHKPDCKHYYGDRRICGFTASEFYYSECKRDKCPYYSMA